MTDKNKLAIDHLIQLKAKADKELKAILQRLDNMHEAMALTENERVQAVTTLNELDASIAVLQLDQNPLYSAFGPNTIPVSVDPATGKIRNAEEGDVIIGHVLEPKMQIVNNFENGYGDPVSGRIHIEYSGAPEFPRLIETPDGKSSRPFAPAGPPTPQSSGLELSPVKATKADVLAYSRENTLSYDGALQHFKRSGYDMSEVWPLAQEWDVERHMQKQNCSRRDAISYFEDQGYDVSEVE